MIRKADGPLTIVLVSADIERVLRHCERLVREGWDAVVSTHVDDAVSRIERGALDGLVTDATVVDTDDGLRLVRLLKADVRTRHVPAIALAETKETKARALSAGCASTLPMACDPDALVTDLRRALRIAALLADRRAQRSAPSERIPV